MSHSCGQNGDPSKSIETLDNSDATKDGDDHDGGKKTQGKIPRSRRTRKRPRSSSDQAVCQTQLRRLELDGHALFGESWIRLVTPYLYTFETFAKARWVGRTILDVYHSEFGSYPKAYYESAITRGRIKVSSSEVNLDYKIRGGDLLTHTVHRHEPAVVVSSSSAGSEIDIVSVSEDLVAVNKPGTLPVHPCGGYHANSLLRILETKFGALYNVNRLDRLTSGLVMLGRTSAVAQQWGKCLKERGSCEKIYLARVKGKFPLNCDSTFEITTRLNTGDRCHYGQWIEAGEKVAGTGTQKPDASEIRRSNALGFWFADSSGAVLKSASMVDYFNECRYDVNSWLRELEVRAEDEDRVLGWLNLACPTRVAKPKDGICEAGAFGDLDDSVYLKTVKPSQTAFGVVRYDSETDSTILLCRPITGRTHQIRLHLQYLGHPIANDPNYGGDMWFADPEGEKACHRARCLLDSLDESSSKSAADTICERPRILLADATPTNTSATEDAVVRLSRLERLERESLNDFIQRTCVWCARSGGGGHHRSKLEFLVRSRGIWLHALQYSMMDAQGTRICHRTMVPPWS